MRHKPAKVPDARPDLVSVGFIHPGEYAACFAESLKEVLFHDLQHRQRIVSHNFGQLSKECGSGGIVEGRNHLARTICDKAPDVAWLFMVDSDMGFAADTVERLVAAADPVERPVLGGLCFAMRNDGVSSFGGIKYRAQPTLYSFHETDDKVGFVPQFTYPADEVVRVSGSGAACLLIHRSALETVRAKFGDNWFTPITHPKGPVVFGEDLSFCVRLAACDIPISVHTGIKTTHAKGFAYLDEQFYVAQEIAAGRRQP